MKNDKGAVTKYGFGGKVIFDARDGNFQTILESEPGFDEFFEDRTLNLCFDKQHFMVINPNFTCGKSNVREAIQKKCTSKYLKALKPPPPGPSKKKAPPTGSSKKKASSPGPLKKKTPPLGPSQKKVGRPKQPTKKKKEMFKEKWENIIIYFFE